MDENENKQKTENSEKWKEKINEKSFKSSDKQKKKNKLNFLNQKLMINERVNFCYTFTRYVFMICFYNMFLQYVIPISFAMCNCDMFLQYVIAISFDNIFFYYQYNILKNKKIKNFDRFLKSKIKQWRRICYFVNKNMLNAANNSNSIETMYEFNQFVLNFEKLVILTKSRAIFIITLQYHSS